MKARLDTLTLLVRCSDLVFGIPAVQVDRIVGSADLEVIAAGDMLRVRVLPEATRIPGWDLGGLLGKPRRAREAWVICQANIGGRPRRFVLACDRSLAVIPVDRAMMLPASMFTSRNGAMTRAFRCSTDTPVGYMLDTAQLVSQLELTAISRDGGVEW